MKTVIRLQLSRLAALLLAGCATVSVRNLHDEAIFPTRDVRLD